MSEVSKYFIEEHNVINYAEKEGQEWILELENRPFLALVSDYDLKESDIVVMLHGYDGSKPYPFITRFGHYKHARVIELDELGKFLYN